MFESVLRQVRSKSMTEIDRRGMLRGILPAAAVVVLGLAIMPDAPEAAPLTIGETAATSEGAEFAPPGTGEAGVVDTKGLDARAQVIVGGRRRRWVCWWHRGRRVCGWRWR
jgi:hypothetical protein